MGFILLGLKNELVISMPISSVANGIGRHTIHIVLKVLNQAGKNYQAKNNMQQLYCSALIIEKMSIIDLKLLISIDKQL